MKSHTRTVDKWKTEWRKFYINVCVYFCYFSFIFYFLFQIANHPLLVRHIYNDEDVVRFAKKLHPLGAFGFECSVERVVEELKSYNDFSIHRVLILSFIITFI